MNKVAICSLCTTETDVLKVQGVQPDLPLLWAQVTIAEFGNQVRNFVLCRSCTEGIRKEMSRLSNKHRDSLEKSNDS